jgi:hypothetical protein
MTQRMLAIVNEIDTYLHGEYSTYISFGKHHGAMPLLPLAWTLMPLLSFSPSLLVCTGPESFPVRVGSHRSLTRPALEFIKAVCHVLALDNTVAQQVHNSQIDTMCNCKPTTRPRHRRPSSSHRRYTKGRQDCVRVSDACCVWPLQVEVMQRLLLTQIGVKQFSEDGIFKDYCRCPLNLTAEHRNATTTQKNTKASFAQLNPSCYLLVGLWCCRT